MKQKFSEMLKIMGITLVIVVCATAVSVGVVALVNWLKPLWGGHVLYGIIGVVLFGGVSYVVYDIRKTNRVFNQAHNKFEQQEECGNEDILNDIIAEHEIVATKTDDDLLEGETPARRAERKFHKMCGVDESKLRPFGDLNYVVQAWVSDDGKTATCDNYMPRKNRVECCQVESREELCKDLADTKERMKMAMVLIDKFIAGEINNFYYWDETSMPDDWADENKSETKENK